MPLGETDTDVLAYELTQTDFDAVERDGYRAEWNVEGTEVYVTELATEDVTEYNAEDLVRATSDQEVENARTSQ
ncbi:hypothetical protein [Haloarchaeobius sp. HME9146]|uniref:hypothetical protein n=1 Tax=Haloarchaeobius sp. HME9146 TaxID=2978732 RepID=UPI0021BFD4B0|nr:hypothetical protein [Haloarchaeobius sp. HME9146]MCT9097639.1 hypothetical protein [Haloarchaeobius sp. HME9146]